MKLLYLGLGITFSIILVILVATNYSNVTTFTYIGQTYTSNTSFIMFLSSFLGVLLTLCFWGYTIANVKQNVSKHLNAAEKANIEAEENSERVKVLEAKVKTLEEALQKALKN